MLKQRVVSLEFRRQSINHVEDVIAYRAPYSKNEGEHQSFLVSVDDIVRHMNLYIHRHVYISPRPDELDPRHFVPRAKDWCQDYVLGHVESKFSKGPIVCQAMFGEVITFSLTDDAEFVSVAVAGVAPSNKEEFTFEIELTDYNHFLIYLYVQSLLKPNRGSLSKIKNMIESV